MMASPEDAPPDEWKSRGGYPDDDFLKHAIEHASHLLPAQGPITVFIHHNTLHAFEDLPFLEGVKKGARVFGCQPFLTEERYREALGRGRIRFGELEAVAREGLGPRAAERIGPHTTRLELRLAMLQYPLRFGPTDELLWFVAETDALRKFRPEAFAVRGRMISETRRWVMRDLRGGNEARRNGGGAPRAPHALDALFARYKDESLEEWDEAAWESFTLQALWRVCCDGIAGQPPFVPPPPPAVRHRDLLFEATGADSDLPVNDLLIRFCAAFLDQGFAHWQLPGRDLGFFHAFCDLYRRPGGAPDRWMKGLPAELARLQDGGIAPLDSIRESLQALGVAREEVEDFFAATFLALRGWGGMVEQVEQRGDRVAHPIPQGSLVEFLAVRLVLDRFALAHTAREALGRAVPLHALRDEARRLINVRQTPSVEQRAFLVFQLAQVLGWSPDELHRKRPGEWAGLLEEVESFNAVERRQTFHLAYERRFYTQTLDAFALHAPKAFKPERPRYQVVTCLDEREESFRRHLEEIAPDVETFGAAGFFAVAMYYRGATDAHFVPLCPIVIRPQHWVEEQVDEKLGELHRRRSRARRALGTASHQFHVGSRTFALGALLSACLGVLATVPLVARILFPRLTARIRARFGKVMQAPPATHLKLERQDPQPGPGEGHVGYSLPEMIAIGERLLRDIGLIDGFARLVLAIGHGSYSLNNPHKSAYDCGACGGSPGAPNGRALARILNDPRVRAGLAGRGIRIPAETWFVGGFHNTCNDSVAFFDVELILPTHRAEFDAARADLEAALDRNAHERSRRFMSAPLTHSFPEARRHVEGRSEDLAQTRPELGHATNALCQVGRRKWTRGLYFDRRMFLTSYDPTQDDADATVLTRTMSAIFPVCGGINLEYFFSHTDSPGYGCGTKLPHNITSLLGVMDGAASDLRTGLPWQMTEIHEPVRLLIIIEAKVETVQRMLEKHPAMCKMGLNGWVQIAVQDPDTAKLKVYRDGAFVDYEPQAEALPQAPSSVDWYRGWREHLEFAEIGQQ
jgi:uncharacterized protein YbcC (UPF0753/DUF2309 family)